MIHLRLAMSSRTSNTIISSFYDFLEICGYKIEISVFHQSKQIFTLANSVKSINFVENRYDNDVEFHMLSYLWRQIMSETVQGKHFDRGNLNNATEFRWLLRKSKEEKL